MSDPGRKPEFSKIDDPLRRDVGFVGALLGEVLKAQGDNELFARVEAARSAAIRRRENEPGADRELAGLVAGLASEEAHELVRAFSSYFSLVNMAEQAHRIRRRRDYIEDPAATQPGGLEAVLRSLAHAGLSLERVREILGRMLIVPVFTAHPTEARRRTVLAKQQRVLGELVDRIGRPEMTPGERQEHTDRLRREITLLWQTEEHPATRPTVADEVEHAIFHLSEVIYRILPSFYEAFAGALDGVFGPGAAKALPCPVIRFGSWVGGDMDGNPGVGPETIEATLLRQRELILERYRSEARELFGHLSQSLSRVAIDEAVLERCRAYEELLPEAHRLIPNRYDTMPYRVLLWLIWERLGATLSDAEGAYSGAGELLDDLELIARSLRSNRGRHAGLALIVRLQQRVATFGFHLATLDIRQDALVHRRAAGSLLGIADFAQRPSSERAALLEEALRRSTPPVATTDDGESRHTIEVLRTLGDARARFGPEAIGPYIISMAQGPDDALALLLLARVANLVDRRGRVPLDIAPLFETVDDLETASATMRSLLGNAAYREHLSGRGDEQLVMLGYSDSSKISGLAASRWGLYRSQEQLIATADDAGIGLTLFHGRGGTVARGGSKPRAAILADPCGAVRGRLRLTEQGEIVHAKYGLPEIAERTLELMSGAVLETTSQCERATAPRRSWAEAMDTVASTGRMAYEALVHADPDFVPYFRRATPIDVIERLEIGSRPPSRRSGGGVENLRAIPWVFAWTQSRHMLPGWYGVGAGLEQAVAQHGEETLVQMAARWPFFTNLLADVEMVLAKADMQIAAHYAELAGSIGERIYPQIRSAFERTCELVTRLHGVEAPLDREPVLQRAIHLRNPYVDPMSLIQVDLLRRWRAGDRTDAALERVLFATVRGIARGLQNTG